jgi:hypothetical protein
MFTLKRLSRDGIDAALKKAQHYRLLNEPWQAESICRDVLEVDPSNREALVTSILSLTDRFATEASGAVAAARKLLPQLESEYDRYYYEGIILERRGNSLLSRGAPGSGPAVYDWLHQAMERYELAERIRPPGNDDALLRWNACARLIMKHPHVRPVTEQATETMLE